MKDQENEMRWGYGSGSGPGHNGGFGVITLKKIMNQPESFRSSSVPNFRTRPDNRRSFAEYARNIPGTFRRGEGDLRSYDPRCVIMFQSVSRLAC